MSCKINFHNNPYDSNNNNQNQNTMCGTVMQFAGMGLALMVEDNLLTPGLGNMNGNWVIDILIKGITTYWIYSYFTCKSRNMGMPAMNNMSFGSLVLGGAVGAALLLISANIAGTNYYGNATYMKYVVQAVVLQFGFTIANNLFTNVLVNEAQMYGYGPTTPYF